MKNSLKFLGILILWFIPNTVCLSDDIAVPPGWRAPSDEETKGEWRNKDVNRYLSIKADFNGDGVTDRARLLLCDKKNTMGVFAFISQKGGTFRSLLLEEDTEANRYIEVMGIGVVRPGRYLTVCGKHIMDCPKGEPDEVSLDHDGIEYFKEGSASMYFYWDSQSGSFKKAYIDD